MIRLGFIGTESSHAGSLMQQAVDSGQVQITAVWGEDDESYSALSERFGLDCRVEKPVDMVGKVDGVMLLTRDGKGHLEQLRPIVEAGIPVYIDKPFTTSVQDARELLALLEKHDVPYTGGTTMKMGSEIEAMRNRYEAIQKTCISGYFAYTIDLDSPYSGMHFYSHHLIESMLYVFGLAARSVMAKRSGDSLVAIVSYDSFNVILNYAAKAGHHQGSVYGSTSYYTAMLGANHTENSHRQFNEFLEVIKTKKSPYPAEFFLNTVKISNAIEQSAAQGREIIIAEVE